MFFVNSRSSGALITGTSILASCVGGSATIGMVGLAWLIGTPAFWWLGSGVCGLLLAERGHGILKLLFMANDIMYAELLHLFSAGSCCQAESIQYMPFLPSHLAARSACFPHLRKTRW